MNAVKHYAQLWDKPENEQETLSESAKNIKKEI
jgi:hypothetical protein